MCIKWKAKPSYTVTLQANTEFHPSLSSGLSSINQFKSSFIGLTFIAAPLRVASRLGDLLSTKIEFVSRFIPTTALSYRPCSRICSAIGEDDARGVSWPSARPDATRRDAAWCGAVRGKGSRRARRAFSRPALVAARWDHHGDRRPHTFIPRDISPWSSRSSLLLAALVAACRSHKARKARARVRFTLVRRSTDWARSHLRGWIPPQPTMDFLMCERGYARLSAGRRRSRFVSVTSRRNSLCSCSKIGIEICARNIQHVATIFFNILYCLYCMLVLNVVWIDTLNCIQILIFIID